MVGTVSVAPVPSLRRPCVTEIGPEKAPILFRMAVPHPLLVRPVEVLRATSRTEGNAAAAVAMSGLDWPGVVAAKLTWMVGEPPEGGVSVRALAALPLSVSVQAPVAL